MRRSLQVIGFRLIGVVAAISLLGLATAFTGIVFGSQVLYKWGLRIAAPLYIIVLPFCILVVIVMLIASCITVLQELTRRIRKKPQND